MNDMNNMGNQFNNQNNDQNNNLNLNQSTNNDGYEKQSNKNNNVLVVILLILVIGLSAFIIYDKFIKKEEPKEPNSPIVNPPVEEENDDNSTDEFVIRNVNGKEVKISFAFTERKNVLYFESEDFPEDNEYADVLAYEIRANGKSLANGNYIVHSDNDNLDFKAVHDKYIDIMKSGVGVIKADKDYLYVKEFDTGVQDIYMNLKVFDENNNVIWKRDVIRMGGLAFVDSSCEGYNEFVKEFNANNGTPAGTQPGEYYITNDAIYYISLEGWEEELHKFDVHKLTFENNKPIDSKVTSCTGTAEGAI